MDFHAGLDNFPIRAFVRMVAGAGFSGVATLESSGKKGRILFKDGNVVYAQSDSGLRLGTSLVEKGVVSDDDVEKALSWQKSVKQHRPLATLLVELGVLSRDALEAETVAHIGRTLRELMTWTSGDLTFKPVRVQPELLVVPKGVPIDDALWEDAEPAIPVEDREVESELLSFLP